MPDSCAKALAPIGKSYGGETVGHVAFLGGRAIQFVLARTPGTYATFMKHAVRGLVLSVVAWEELYARIAAEAEGPREEREEVAALEAAGVFFPAWHVL